MVVLIALVALTTREPPPPTVAEFAPQAIEQIKKAPTEQSAVSGSAPEGSGGDAPGGIGPGKGAGNGGGSGDGGTGGPAAEGPPIEVPNVRRCVGDPPRQIEDPQSPPCVPFFQGDNGGATSKGVTRDRINVVLGGDCDRKAQLWVDFFNRRFEFYGRKIKLICYDARGGAATEANTADMQADAARVDTEFNAFASLEYPDRYGKEYVFYDELARRKIVGSTGRPGYYTEQSLREHHPYQWAWVPGVDVILRNQATWMCSALKGRNAEYAGADYKGKPRKFGLVEAKQRDGTGADVKEFKAILQSCGITFAQEYVQTIGDNEDSSASNIVVSMKKENITSIVWVGYQQGYALSFYRASQTQQYEPEWLASTYLNMDDPLLPLIFPNPGQMDHTVTLTWFNKHLRPEDSAWNWALVEQDPSFRYVAPPFEYDQGQKSVYPGLLLLASGIQMAGPNLNPQTFGAALQRTKFPNPLPGAAPYYQAQVGFEGNDHTMSNEASIMWGNPQARHNWSGNPGAYCFARQGVRYAIGRRPWPSDGAGLFELPCY